MQIRPPDEREKYSYISNRKWFVVVTSGISTVMLTTGAWRFSTSHDSVILFLPFFVFTAVYLALSACILIFGGTYSPAEHEQTCEDYRTKARESSVDVFLPICGENKEVVLNVWNAVKQMDWPRHLLTIYVLDDSPDEAMKIEAEQRGFKYIRRDNRSFKKAGNLLNGFRQSNGEFILILDADFAPRYDFLNEVVPYFLAEKRLSIVQTPQYFEVSRWMTWVEQSAGQVQEFFYRLVQISRDRFGGSICVGSCAVYRRQSLDSVGGFRQIGHSEDVWTGFTTINNGWRIKYVPLILSKGRCPDNLRAFFNQQYRWCTGSMSLGCCFEFWQSKLTIAQLLCYFSGMMYYAASAFSVLLLPLPAVVVVNFFPNCVDIFNVVYYLPASLFGFVIMWMWSSYRKMRVDVLRICQTLSYAHLIAIVDRIRCRSESWVPTGATHAARRSRFDIYRFFCFWYSTFVLLALFTGAARNWHMANWYDFAPSLVTGILYYWASMSCLRDQ